MPLSEMAAVLGLDLVSAVQAVPLTDADLERMAAEQARRPKRPTPPRDRQRPKRRLAGSSRGE